MLRIIILSVWFLGVLGAVSQYAVGQSVAFDPSRLSQKGAEAFITLKNTDLFAIGGIGYGGEISKGERALDILIEEKQSLEAFQDLIDGGTIEGALYGLFGLQMLNCECLSKELARLKAVHLSSENLDPLQTQSGCLFFTATTSAQKGLVLKEMDNWFEKGARLKECRRQTNGRPADTRRCVSEVLSNK